MSIEAYCKQLESDLEVERAALILRTRERDHYAAWALDLAAAAEAFIYENCTKGGLLQLIAQFRDAQIGERP
jgi:hypothetical protein